MSEMNTNRKKIVVIDDDETTLRTIERILEAYDYVTFGAATGREGIDLINRTQPDIVLCDVMMPGMSGYEVLLELRNHAATATIPVLLLSARRDPDEIRHGMKLGADDYLTKPFSTEDLLRCIEVRITQREKIVQQSSQQLEQLRRSIAMRLPHEFRTPLSSIIVFGELLAGDYDRLTREQAMEMISTIVSSGHRLSALVENFIYLARLEIMAGQAGVNEELASFILPGAEAIMQETAKHQAMGFGNLHRVVMNLAPADLRISDAYLRKIIAELMSNACKFSMPKSTITLAGEQRGDFYVISIQDEGRGMKPEQIANIGAYMQFDRDRHEQQGQGLGLEITKRIVELHGGSLTISSTPNVGTIVQVFLPKP
ncbi:MAG: response regulator [Candidatus Kapabacteria bacterium]|nr:response regulator [Candidatus Kapabacteria bacterium]